MIKENWICFVDKDSLSYNITTGFLNMKGVYSIIDFSVLVRMFAFFCCFIVKGCASLPIAERANSSDASGSDGYHIYKAATREMINIMENCSLIPKFKEENENIADLINDGNTHVKVSITLEGNSGPFSKTYAGHLLRPLNWIIVTSVTGKRILMLKEYFVEMTFHSLGQSVVTTDLTLVQNPPNCLKDKTQVEVENSLRSSFLRNFKNNGTLLHEEAEICNRHLNELDGEGQVVYKCCHENARKTIECSEVQRTTLMKVLFMFITVLKWFAVCCIPLFIPKSVYRARNVFSQYIFQTGEKRDMVTFTVKKVKVDKDTQKYEGFEVAKIQPKGHMSRFKGVLDEKMTRFNTIYTFCIKEVLFTVRNSKIIKKGNAPVSFLGFLNNFFIRCKMRHVIRSSDDFCDARVLKCLPEEKCKCTWDTCLKYPMEFMKITACFSPLAFRLLCYYTFERPFVRDQIELMDKRNLKLHIENTEIAEYPLTYVLSKEYYSLAIFCCCFILIEFLIYKTSIFNICIPTDLMDRIETTFRKSVRDIRQIKKSKICSYYICALLHQLRKCGLFSVLIFPLSLIFLCIPLSIEVIPVTNFIGRLVKNFISNIENMKTWKNIIHFITLIFVVLGLIICLLLIMECLSFYVELIIYILVGFILNPGVSLRYVSMIVLIAVYGNECFSGVYNRFVLYNNAISSKVLEMVGDKVQDVASLSKTEQENVVFRIPKKVRPKLEKSALLTQNEEKKKKEKKICSCFRSDKKQDELELEERTTLSIIKEKKIKEKHALLTRNKEKIKVNILFPCFKLLDEIKNVDGQQHIFELGSEGFLKLRVPRLVLFLDRFDMLYIPKSFLFEMAKLPHYLCPGPVHLLYLKAITDFSLIIIFLVFVFIVIFAFGQIQNISTGGQTIAALGSGLLPLFLRRFLFRSQDSPDVNNSDLQWRNMFENAVHNYSERWNFEDILIETIHEQNTDELNFIDETELNTTADLVKTEIKDITEHVRENIQVDKDVSQMNYPDPKTHKGNPEAYSATSKQAMSESEDIELHDTVKENCERQRLLDQTGSNTQDGETDKTQPDLILFNDKGTLRWFVPRKSD